MMKENAGSLLRRYPQYKISLLLCTLLLLSYFSVHAAILSQASALIELEHNSVSAISNFLHLPLPDMPSSMVWLSRHLRWKFSF